MNIEAIKNRSKSESKKALELFKWDRPQKLVLELIADDGFVTFNHILLMDLFGKVQSLKSYNTEEMHDCVLLWDFDFKNGSKSFRKRDINFMPLI